MILNYIKLIRGKDLLIIAFTQYLMRYCIIFPILEYKGYVSQFSDLNFLFLVISTIMIAAAGYVINDYFDTKTDIINRPKRVVVGKHISRRTSIRLHIIFSLVGILIGFYISYKINLWKLVYIHVLVTGLLWFYSTSYKRQFLTGNIIVALLTALVPLMTILYEIPPLNVEYSETLILLKQNFYNISYWILGFTIFAFLTTIVREIIKDIEDFEGDRAYGRRTMPVVSGIKITKIVVITITIIVILMLFFVYFFKLHNLSYYGGFKYMSAIYLTIFLLIPNTFFIYKLIKAKSKEDWHFANNLSKIIMLFGILYSLVVCYHYTN